MTASETLCTALARAARARGIDASFPLSDVVLLCWRENPELFAMRGYPHHPDNKRVGVAITDAISKGLLTSQNGNPYGKTGRRIGLSPREQATYLLTKKGMERSKAKQ